MILAKEIHPKRDAIFYSFCWGDVMTTLGAKTHENSFEATGRPLLDLRPGDEPFTHPFFSAGKNPETARKANTLKVTAILKPKWTCSSHEKAFKFQNF